MATISDWPYIGRKRGENSDSALVDEIDFNTEEQIDRDAGARLS
jgi:hypothetical protein